jgi:putative ABC transport system permease protein
VSRLPPGLSPLLRALVPEEFADDLIGDLEERWAERRADGRLRASLWLTREVATTPFFALRRQALRMRRRGERRSEDFTGGAWHRGDLTAGLAIALRSLRKRPAFAAAAISTLVASIGAATLVFSVLEGVILRPLPYPGGDRLYYVHGTNEAWRDADDELMRGAWESLMVTEAMVDRWRTSAPEVESVGAFHDYQTAWNDERTPAVRPSGAWILPGFFETLGLDPLLGRFPSASEVEAGDAVVVIGERFWGTRYGRDPEVLGQTVTVEGTLLEIIGVAPTALAIPDERSVWWAPTGPDFAEGRTDSSIFEGIVRLRPGADPATVDAGLDELVSRIAEEDPAYARLGVRLELLRDTVVDDVSEGLTYLFLSVALIVLIASVNLANLVLVRASQRRGELAMRAAIGASRSDLVWAMLSETVVVCVVGGGLGVLLATQATGGFVGFMSQAIPDFPRADNVGLNPLVLSFSIGVTGLTVLLAGLLPGLAASRRPPWEALRSSRRGGHSLGTRRTQRALLFVEAVMAMLLLGTAGLLTRSAVHVFTTDPGFDDESAAFVEIRPSDERYPDDEAVRTLVERLEERLAALPGVTAVGTAMAPPAMGGTQLTTVRTERQTAGENALFALNRVTPGYFEVLEIPLVRGRLFDEGDVVGAENVVVISQRMARELFGQDDPLGRTLHLGRGARFSGGNVVAEREDPVTIVGIVSDVRQVAIVLEPDALLYQPLAQVTPDDPSIMLRTDGHPTAVLAAARAAVLEVDPGLFVGRVEALRGGMQRILAALYVRTALIGVLAALACFLTIVGIYGVVAYVVSDQVREIGLRMALGARSAGEESRVVLHALKPVVLGSLLGLLGAYAVQTVLESELFGVEAFDAPTYLVVLVMLTGASAAAAWLPARRAATVDPARVLSE